MKKRPILFLLLSLLTLLSLSFLVFSFDPSFQLSILQSQFSIQLIFFLLLFIFLFSLCTYLFKSKTHGVLIALFAVTYLVFRINDLTHPFFLVLLAALFLTVELLVSYRK